MSSFDELNPQPNGDSSSLKTPSEIPEVIRKYPMITAASLCNVLRYGHLGISVSKIENSIAFYQKIGFFKILDLSTSYVTVMRNRGNLELHLFKSDKDIEDNQNILMDLATEKYAGLNHASVVVPCVSSTRAYLESSDILITGERKNSGALKAIFARDPDRTTWEFENNHSIQVETTMSSVLIGYPKGLDHIGIRVTDPEASLLYYAKTFGFNQLISRYTPNPDPLKNMPPWVVRTMNDYCDINFILNGNMFGRSENILIQGNEVRPGIVYVGFEIDSSCDMNELEQSLKSAGVAVVRESKLQGSALDCLASRIVPNINGQESLFVEDGDRNIIRLVLESPK